MIRIAPTAALVALLVSSAAAQSSVTSSDIQRLQDSVYLADRDVSNLRSRDATRATQLQAELDELRDEVIYLKVKLRKEGSLARAEYGDVRDRIEDVRTRARGDAAGAYSVGPAAPSPPAAAARPASPAPAATPTPATGSAPASGTRTQSAGSGGTDIPVGTEVDVRLLNTLNSGTAQVEDRFEGTTVADLVIDGRTVVPAGSVLRGVISSVRPATRTNRTAEMTVSFDLLVVNGREYPIRATVTQAIQGEGIKGEMGRTGVGAAVGGVLGAALGGLKGAVIGAVIGGGGTIAATEGKEVELPQGTILRARFESPVAIAR